jgi:asparagine synthase (glutamine-hydrolysing)
MCGICGIVQRDGPINLRALQRMMAAIRHRGPDDEGFYVTPAEGEVAAGLGFRRLSIIDLVTGNQPIANEDGSVHVVFNGEIYNYRELRSGLESRGHRFATDSDTEVIVHLYEELGAQCVERLNGMFAIALWDAQRGELVLARDRFGKKPLYYTDLGASFLFGSELKSLLEHPSCPRELDFDGLSRYLALEYVPTPHSILAGIRKLPGGHVLRWRDGRISLEQFWDLELRPDQPPRSDEQYVDEFRELFQAAVRRRLVSDVPLGAFLSGGIDSSSVVAMMVEALPAGAVKTFSVGFEEESFDESLHARRVAGHFGTDHHEEVFTSSVMLDTLPTVIDWLDEPFGDASILPTYLLSRFTREHVTVALGGDGSDELLAGYPTFPADRLARFYRVPRLLHSNLIVPLADRFPVSTANFSFDFKLKRFLRAAAAREDVRHAVWLGSFTPGEQAELLTAAPPDPFAEQRRLLASARGDHLGPAGRHPREGRPSKHGLLTRGTRSFSRCRARRVPVTRPFAAQAPSPRHEASPEAGHERSVASRHRHPCEEGVRDSGRRLVQGRAARGAAGRALARADPPAGALRAGRGESAPVRAPFGPPGPPQALVDAVRVPTLAPPLARGPFCIDDGRATDPDRVAILARR